MKTIIITRKSDDGIQTLGEIVSTDGLFKRVTLERPYKNNQTNISCIPKGTYVVKWAFMWRRLTYHYLFQNVPGRSGIFIHAGNYWFDVLGCILLGTAFVDINYDGKKDVINSAKTVKEFEAYMDYKDFNLVVQ